MSSQLAAFLAILGVACCCQISPLALAQQEAHRVESAEPREGVFLLANLFSSTVVELKNGRFRCWFETDVMMPNPPEYPLGGAYSVSGSTITLQNDQVGEPTWTFRLLDGELTLWRPGAVDRTSRSIC